jgi:hypothetical protein
MRKLEVMRSLGRRGRRLDGNMRGYLQEKWDARMWTGFNRLEIGLTGWEF